jgi:flavin-dependent dehydrogenase
MVLRTPAGRVLRARYSHAATPPARRVDGRSLTRARLDPALLDLAIKNGVVVESGFLVRDVRHEGRLVRVTGRLRGRPTDRWARVAVGADGRHSAMARRVGAVHRHPWPDRMALVAHVAGVERDEAADELVPPKDLSLWRLLRRGAVRPSVPA